MKTKCANFVSMGAPPIPLVPTKDFDRLNYAMLKQAWWIVGPSVDRNLSKCAIWEVIAAAYLEGLNHGYAMKELHKPSVKHEVFYGS